MQIFSKSSSYYLLLRKVDEIKSGGSRNIKLYRTSKTIMSEGKIPFSLGQSAYIRLEITTTGPPRGRTSSKQEYLHDHHLL